MDEETSEEVMHIFNGAEGLLDFVSNSTRAIAYSLWVARWIIPFSTTVQRESGGLLDAKTKEIAVIRISIVNNCEC